MNNVSVITKIGFDPFALEIKDTTFYITNEDLKSFSERSQGDDGYFIHEASPDRLTYYTVF